MLHTIDTNLIRLTTACDPYLVAKNQTTYQDTLSGVCLRAYFVVTLGTDSYVSWWTLIDRPRCRPLLVLGRGSSGPKMKQVSTPKGSFASALRDGDIGRGGGKTGTAN